MFDVTWVRRELERLSIPPLKRFGQHFLVDKAIREKLVELAALTMRDTVLEVGPGLGFLTSMLLTKAGHVIAVEKDRTLAGYLKKKFSESKNLDVIQGDILTTTIPENSKIVSSPPYNISSRLVLQILASKFKLAVLLMQIEFVRRLTASPGSRDYGRLSVMLQSRAEAKLVTQVAQSSFYPRPRVESAIVTIAPAIELLTSEGKIFEDIVRALFTQRRRKLTTVLSKYLQRCYPEQSDNILRQITIPEKRVYETTPKELGALSDQIVEILAARN